MNNYETVPGLTTPSPLIDNINVSTYTVSTNASFNGDKETKSYIDHVNKTILPKLHTNR
nr:MAG TPA: hypothetical protein [Bacteriophage sp.]